MIHLIFDFLVFWYCICGVIFWYWRLLLILCILLYICHIRLCGLSFLCCSFIYSEFFFRVFKGIGFKGIRFSFYNYVTCSASFILAFGNFLYIYIYIYIYIYQPIRLEGRVFTNSPGDWGSIPRRVIPKTQKWCLMPPCLTLHIKRYRSRVSVSIQGKDKRIILLLGVLANEKSSKWSLSTSVTNFTL